MRRLPVSFLLAAALLLSATAVQAERKLMRVDPTANKYEAMKEFLFVEGYWEDETRAVLDPLEGQLSLDHGTPDCHLVGTMDDIPGLRPLPEGVIEFLHRHHTVFYVAVGDDHLLVGIAQDVQMMDGEVVSSRYHFAKFDLITGAASAPDAEAAGRRDLTAFLYAHDTHLGKLLYLLVMGAALLAFLAVRLRRRRLLLPRTADPVVARWRLRAEAQIFRVTAALWVAVLLALYGLMHFTARIGFMEMAATSEELSYEMAGLMGFAPDRLRLISLIIALTLAVGTSLALGVWSGALRRLPASEETNQGGV